MRIPLLAPLVVLFALLAGCSSGGGNDSEESSIPAKVVITLDKGDTLGALASETLMDADMDFVELALDSLDEEFSSEKSTASIVVSGERLCDSGKLIFSFDDANNSGQADAGDSGKLAFFDCLRNGVILNGGIAFFIHDLSETLLDVGFTYAEFSLRGDGHYLGIDGALRISRSSDGDTKSLRLRFNELRLIHDGDELVIHRGANQYLRDSVGNTTVSIDLLASSTRVGGSFSIVTREPLHFPVGSPWPETGILRLTGASGSYVELDANTGDINTVDITIFDGSVTVTIRGVPWESLHD